MITIRTTGKSTCTPTVHTSISRETSPRTRSPVLSDRTITQSSLLPHTRTRTPVIGN